MARNVPNVSGRTGNFRLWQLGKRERTSVQTRSISPTSGEDFEKAVFDLFLSAGAAVQPAAPDIDFFVSGHHIFDTEDCRVECKLMLLPRSFDSILKRWPIGPDELRLLVVAGQIPRPLPQVVPPNVEVITYDALATYLSPWINARRQIRDEARPGPRVVKAVTANRTSILLGMVGLSALIADRLVRLHEERDKRNDPDTIATIDQSISDYEELAGRIVALEKAVREYNPADDKDVAVTKPVNTLKHGIRAWWNKNHQRICTNAYDAGIFAGLVGVCVAAGSSGGLAVTIPAVLVGGKPVAKVISEIAKGFFKSGGKDNAG